MRHKKECKVVGFCSPSYQQPLSLSWTESHLQKKKKKKKVSGSEVPALTQVLFVWLSAHLPRSSLHAAPLTRRRRRTPKAFTRLPAIPTDAPVALSSSLSI